MSHNPAILDGQDIMASAAMGALAALGLFSLGILYQALRSAFRKN